MFELKVKDEDIIMEVTANKELTKNEVDNKGVKSTLSETNSKQISLILCVDTLHIVYKGQASGEIINSEEIKIENMNDFLISEKEGQEIIQIKTENKDFMFIKDKSKGDNSALDMSKIINDILFIINN